MADGRFEPVEGTTREIPAELVLLAMGFTGPEQPGLLEQLGVDLDPRGNIARDAAYMSSVPGVFVAGDAGRGPVADRLGHRGGPGGGRRRGRLAHGRPVDCCRGRSRRPRARSPSERLCASAADHPSTGSDLPADRAPPAA